jgi:hypothetical protein
MHGITGSWAAIIHAPVDTDNRGVIRCKLTPSGEGAALSRTYFKDDLWTLELEQFPQFNDFILPLA